MEETYVFPHQILQIKLMRMNLYLCVRELRESTTKK